jgi:hypothetical protein
MQWQKIAQWIHNNVPHIFMFYLFTNAEPASKVVLKKKKKTGPIKNNSTDNV